MNVPVGRECTYIHKQGWGNIHTTREKGKIGEERTRLSRYDVWRERGKGLVLRIPGTFVNQIKSRRIVVP